MKILLSLVLGSNRETEVQRDKIIFLRHWSSMAVLAVDFQSCILASGIKTLDAMSSDLQRKPPPNAMPQAHLWKYLMSKILIQVALK